MFGLVGDYRYSGTVIAGRKYSIVRNGDHLLRVREVSDHQPSKLLWDESMPMTLAVLDILKCEIVNPDEVRTCRNGGEKP